MKWKVLQKIYAEKVLFKVIVLLALVVAVSQLAVYQDPMEREFKLSQLMEEQITGVTAGFGSEVTTWVPPGPTTQVVAQNDEYNGILTLRMVNYYSVSKVKVLVNGAEQTDFLQKNITLKVRAGDRVSLDGTAFPWEVIIEVLDTSPGIAKPVEGSIIKLKGDTKSLEEVQL